MIANPIFLKARFAEAGITHAAVIDEAFDDVAAVKLASEIDEFWDTVQDNPAWQMELAEKNIPHENKDRFITEGLKYLWSKRSEFTGEIGAFIIKRLFARAFENLAAPQKVVNYLKNEFGIANVFPVNGEDGSEKGVPNEARLVFLDYNLEGDEGHTLKPEARRSVRIAKSLLSRHSNAPFLVLFSSLNQAQSQAEEFRIHTGYLRGTFLFISKADALDLQELCDRLASSCVESRDLGRFQHFFLAISARLDEVTAKVKNDVMQLDVQDYAFMQRMALQEDGAALGEYMLELFGTVLSHELRNGEEVLTARHELDKLYFGQNHLPFSTQPSIPIREIYRAVLTEPGVGDAKPHPQADAGNITDSKGKQYKAPPLLMLGDIFARDSKAVVYAVMNPACDLQYSPKNPKHPPKLKLAVYMITGRLENLNASLSPGTQKRLEILEFGKGKYWRVRWYRDEIITVPLGSFAKWTKKERYKRIARLSGIQALSLQWFWTSNLNRVGLPVSLPFYDACDISLYLPTAKGRWHKMKGNCSLQAIVVRHPRSAKEPVHFTLTQDGCKFLYRGLTQAVERLTGQPKRKSSAEALLADHLFWSNIRKVPRELEIKADFLRCLVRPENSRNDTLLFQWTNKPQPEDLTANQNIALMVILNPSRDSKMLSIKNK